MTDVFTFIWVVVPIMVGLLIIALVVVLGQAYKARVSGVSKRFYEELKQENANIITELADIKETLNSINKMLKEIE